MCAQCMVGAMTATAAATGVRAWVATRVWARLNPRWLKAITLILLAAGFVASATFLSA